MEEAIKNEQ